ncbi:MAG: AAA family ATPase [Phycisphaerae bacterium]
MYAEFFGLREQPFNDTWDPRYSYSTPGHEEALASLIYAVGALKGLMVLTGEAGTGKTLVYQRMLAHFGRRIAFAELGRGPLQEDNLFSSICLEFGIEVTPSDAQARPPNALRDFLLEQFAAVRPAVLIVDDAHFLSLGTLELLRLLNNIETQDAKLLQIILIGQPELTGSLNHPKLRHLRQRCFRACNLSPLDRQQTEGYIRHRLKAAGAEEPDLFDAPAIDVVYQVSRGIVRVINTVCDNVMLSAYSCDTRRIDADLIRSVADRTMQFSGPSDSYVLTSAAAPDEPMQPQSAVQSATTSIPPTPPAADAWLASQVAFLERRVNELAGHESSEAGVRELRTQLAKRLDAMQGMLERLHERQEQASRESSEVRVRQLDSHLSKRLDSMEGKFDQLQSKQEQAGRQFSEAKLQALNSHLSKELDTMVDGLERFKSRQAHEDSVRQQNRSVKRIQKQSERLEGLAASLRKTKTHLVAGTVRLRNAMPKQGIHSSRADKQVGRPISMRKVDANRLSRGDGGTQAASTHDSDAPRRIDELRARTEATLPHATPARRLLESVRSLSRLAQEVQTREEGTEG